MTLKLEKLKKPEKLKTSRSRGFSDEVEVT
jgi:hypothetical protein